MTIPGIMTKRGGGIQLDVAGLLGNGSLRSTRPLYMTPASARVSNVVIVTQLDAITRVSPNTVVVLAAELGVSGWLVSAALRHAWERRASAVVVAGRSYSSAVVALAERLGITLLVTEDDPASVALELAASIAVARSVVDSQLAAFARAVAKESTVHDVLAVVSRELGGILVTLRRNGVMLSSAGALGKDATAVMVDVRGVDGDASAQLSASTHMATEFNRSIVRSILEVAAPSVQAARLLEEIRDAVRAAPTSVLSDMVFAEIETVPDTEGPYLNVLNNLGWLPDKHHTAVWILPSEKEHPRTEVTAVLRLLWRKVAPHSALAEVSGGWLSLVPVAQPEDGVRLHALIEAHIGAAFAELGISAGVSGRPVGQPSVITSVHEARLAAQHARNLGPGNIESFGQLGVQAASSLIDHHDILRVGQLALPLLMAASDRNHVILAVKAFLDHQSAVIPAAKFLHVHRNTLQARLSRARDLGIPLDDPNCLLSIHLILTVLSQSLRPNHTTKNSSEDARGNTP